MPGGQVFPAFTMLLFLPLTAVVSGQGEQALVHQDLHGEQVLAAEREPWLLIDPKPLTAEREFALAPIVTTRRRAGFWLKHEPYRAGSPALDLGTMAAHSHCAAIKWSVWRYGL
jgi:hypothetical protein